MYLLNLLKEELKYFLFSDDINASQEYVNTIFGNGITDVSGGSDFLDFFLMTQCKHFINTNSTFSWWGAWLSDNKEKEVFVPSQHTVGICMWGFKGLVPDKWTTFKGN